MPTSATNEAIAEAMSGGEWRLRICRRPTARRHALVVSVESNQHPIEVVGVRASGPILCLADGEPVLTARAAAVLALVIRARLPTTINRAGATSEGTEPAEIGAQSEL